MHVAQLIRVPFIAQMCAIYRASLHWPELGRRIDIRCFTHDPSIASSLKFLRRTPWARERVEALYLDMRWREG